MKYLITGGCGFLGSNIAAGILRQGDQLVVFDNLSRLGAPANLEWLQTKGDFHFVHGDIRNANDVERLVKDVQPDAVFHLAGQVAMTTSIADPRRDFEINALGSFNLLDSVRLHAPKAVVIYSSTNKVYGDLEWTAYEESETRYHTPEFPSGFPESIPLDFHSPYGTSKGSADQYMLDYHRIFGLKTIIFRHSSMYGGRQFATYDQGWIGWFCRQAVETMKHPHREPFTISGNGKQVRDVLHAEDMVRLYLLAAEQSDKLQGQAFNIGGGMGNSLSLLELFKLLEELLGVTLKYTKLPPRESDQKLFVADLSLINRLTGWSPQVDTRSGINKMVEWVKSCD